MKYLRVLRPVNLLIVLLSLVLFQYVIHTNADHNYYNLSFILLCGAALIITGSGNLINDIFDVQIDQYNQEKHKLIPQHISIKAAWQWYFVLLVIGLVLSIIVALQLDKLQWIILYPICCLALYLYSSHFKMLFGIGNFLISAFCAALPWILWIAYKDQLTLSSHNNLIIQLLWCYSALMFFSTFYREIIKDIEDIEGDRHFKASTIPIVLGIKNAKWISIAMLCILVIAVILYLNVIGMNRSKMDIAYFLLFILLPAVYLIFQTYKAQAKMDFQHLSRQAKLFMLSGMLFLIFHFII